MKNTENTIVKAPETAETANPHFNEITAIITGNDSPKAMMNRLDDYHGSDIADVISTSPFRTEKSSTASAARKCLAIFLSISTKKTQELISTKWISAKRLLLYPNLIQILP